MRFIHKDANLSRLVTKQDNYNIHKTLGFLSVCSFVYRYGYVYPSQGDLGMDGRLFDWVEMLVHIMLASTSLIFHIPKKRIPDKPLVIYEEYRLHAIIFTLKCFFTFFIAVLFPERPWYVIPAIAGLHHYGADMITQQHGSDGNTAVRSTSERLQISDFYKKMSLVYSFYQFLAIASHLIYNQRSADLGYNALIAIQSSAFLMTLYRKKIITGKTHMLAYSGCLVLSSYHILMLLDSYTVFLTFCAFVTRIKTSISKYLIWSGFLFLNHFMNHFMKMNS